MWRQSAQQLATGAGNPGAFQSTTSHEVPPITPIVAAKFLLLSRQVPAVEFFKFPDLPLEIRYDIYDWIIKLASGRVVHLRWDKNMSRTFSYSAMPTDVSSLRKTCRETASRVDKDYPLAFAIENNSSLPSIRFNFAIDILYICREFEWVHGRKLFSGALPTTLLAKIKFDDLNKVRRLCIDIEEPITVLTSFGNLDEFYQTEDLYEPWIDERWMPSCHSLGFEDACPSCVLFKQELIAEEVLYVPFLITGGIDDPINQLKNQVKKLTSDNPLFKVPTTISFYTRLPSSQE